MRIYEVNTRVRHPNFDQIPAGELQQLSQMGFDATWLMGVWGISGGARKLSKVISEEFEGSPFAVPAYEFSQSLGGREAFERLVRRAHDAGLRVIVDFVSNHLAIDSPLIGERPEYFIRSNPRLRRQSISEYFFHHSGEVFAFGRDPHFPPWYDTVQLDYTCEGLRRYMVDVLKQISQLADGVRCDMAMLVLRDYIRRQWYPWAPEKWFNQRMPGEFWDEAITEVKKSRPDFLFVAEAYWDKEEYLLDIGFDLSYEKRLYDAIVARDAHLIAGRLTRSPKALAGSLCFVENHDEPRAASVLTTQQNLAAMALLLCLPGSVLIHEGQMEGWRERLPVQRIKAPVEEPIDAQLRSAYLHLLEVTAGEIFRAGAFSAFETGAEGVIGVLRTSGGRAVAYLGQLGEGKSKFSAAHVDISAAARAVSAGGRLLVRNILRPHSTVVESVSGAFLFSPAEIGVTDGELFCLVELSPD